MLWAAHISSPLCRLAALAVGVLLASPAHAEFPPEGATSDPSNPSIASGEVPDPSHKGVLRHFIFYFDCGRGDWIGTSVTDTKTTSAGPPRTKGVGGEFLSGPPLGSKRVSRNPEIATDAATGQTFRLQNGKWFNAKTGKLMRSPKLCPERLAPPVLRPPQNPGSEHGSGQGSSVLPIDKLPPAHTPSHKEQEPDQLPPPPKFLSDRGIPDL